jgi:hypothetical protein
MGELLLREYRSRPRTRSDGGTLDAASAGGRLGSGTSTRAKKRL